MNKIERHQPERTCVGCAKIKNKDQLLRITISAAKILQLDAGKKLPGRGAYVCPDKKCVDAAIKRKRFNKLYNSNFSEQQYRDLSVQVNEWLSKTKS
jgi:uncharacterized protein